MNNNFKEKLQLYKAGRLNELEADAVEKEIDRFVSIREYLEENDDTFIEIIKEEMNQKISEESTIVKKINRKMLRKIISLSLVTIFVCLIVLPIIYLSTISLIGEATRVDSTRFVQEHIFTEQLMKMSFPQYTVKGGSDHTEFYKQNFTCNYSEGISRSALTNKIEVSYSFGRLKKPMSNRNNRLQFFYSDMFYAVNSQTNFNSTEWNILSKAPKGTKAQIFITFKTKLSPEQATMALGKEYLSLENDFNITMLADINSEIVLGNVDPVNYYENNRKYISKQEERDFITGYNNYDNDIHKQVMLYGLLQIKNHRRIADYVAVNFGFRADKVFKDIDESISYVEKNGVQYVGAIISGDTKELLKIKDNPNVVACTILDLVVW